MASVTARVCKLACYQSSSLPYGRISSVNSLSSSSTVVKAGNVISVPRLTLKSESVITQRVRKKRIPKKSLSVVKAALLEKEKAPYKYKTSTWTWSFQNKSITITYEEWKGNNNGPCSDVLLLPTISDVSTTEEWHQSTNLLLSRGGTQNWRAVIVDWPGFGLSDRPSIEYTADVMERFLVDFLSANDGPFNQSGSRFAIVGGGHAATLAVRATKRGLIKPSTIVAVAPTWAGPLPIVFGRDSDTEVRYGLLRSSLQAPAIGWMMYKVLVSNKKSIESQYKSHVYADSQNVTPSLIQKRYALTNREGARFAPAAFLTGKLDPVQSREEFLALFAELEGEVPIMVISTKSSPKRSKAEMDALCGAKGISRFSEVPGALLPQEEYPDIISEELFSFLKEHL
eukprot:TRINITY_DN28702_c0_g1_i1.p1 TRINITY_DN28702_c0_g1~~TRINITY_DN28702_c0_g1_i1.p1  ORF type:complete len:441 (-),score=69.78 TRINITY_DN28702_c0_g1_i1:137-1333(-)